MAEESPTAKLRTLDVLQPHPDDDDSGDGIPVYRPPRTRRHERERETAREESRSFAQAAVDRADHIVREKLGAGLTEEGKAFFSTEIQKQLDLFGRRLRDRHRDDRDDRTTERYASESRSVIVQRASVAWFVASLLGVALFVGALWATWDKIRTVEHQQREDAQYAMVVANWLVVEAEVNYERAINLDRMLRLIAAQVGADVQSVPAPTRLDPPTPIQRKHTDYLLSQGK